MILLDTNVISEMMKLSPDPRVVSWMKTQDKTTVFVSTITLGELAYGICALPAGQRRASLQQGLDRIIHIAFKSHVLSFDIPAAQAYGKILAKRKAARRPISIADGQIAAIAYSQGLILATRNSPDFIDCDVALINPFIENEN